MLYAESLRHFVQEWIKVEPPKRFKEWPWSQTIWLVNLYAQSSSQVVNKMPEPFVSFLFDADMIRRYQIAREDLVVYKGYFNKGDFSVPRRYTLRPDCNSERTFRTNRYSYTSDGYGRYVYDWNKADLRLIRFMSYTPHLRHHTAAHAPCIDILLNRLGHLETKWDMKYNIAENIMDFSETSRHPDIPDTEYAPETFLIGAPITGLLEPLRKAKGYRIINGVLPTKQQDHVFLTIPREPCQAEYEKIIKPLNDFPGIHMRAMPNVTRSVVFCCVECMQGIFSFDEYFPTMVVFIHEKQFCRVVRHTFTLGTELVGEDVELRMRHLITEGLLPKDRTSKPYLQKHPEALFQRSDLPKGVTIDNGVITCHVSR